MNIKIFIIITTLGLIYLEPAQAAASDPKKDLMLLKKNWERLDRKIDANLTDPKNIKAFKILEQFRQKHTEERMNRIEGKCPVTAASKILRSSRDEDQNYEFSALFILFENQRASAAHAKANYYKALYEATQSQLDDLHKAKQTLVTIREEEEEKRCLSPSHKSKFFSAQTDHHINA